jgi:hypothetical protein
MRLCVNPENMRYLRAFPFARMLILMIKDDEEKIFEPLITLICTKKERFFHFFLHVKNFYCLCRYFCI